MLNYSCKWNLRTATWWLVQLDWWDSRGWTWVWTWFNSLTETVVWGSRLLLLLLIGVWVAVVEWGLIAILLWLIILDCLIWILLLLLLLSSRLVVLRLLLLLSFILSWLVLDLVLVSSSIGLWSVVLVTLSRWPQNLWLLFRDTVLWRFLKFVSLRLLFLGLLLRANLVGNLLFLVTINLLLILTTFTVVLSSKNIKLLVSSRSIRDFNWCFLIRHIVVLWLCLLLLVRIVIWLWLLAVVLTAILLLLCRRLHLSTATLSRYFIISPSKTERALTTYQD